jgi:hypothetical protein
MSKYSLVYCTDRELPEWLVVKGYSVVFKSSSKEEAEAMYEEYLIAEQGEELALFDNQESEFDYV